MERKERKGSYGIKVTHFSYLLFSLWQNKNQTAIGIICNRPSHATFTVDARQKLSCINLTLGHFDLIAERGYLNCWELINCRLHTTITVSAREDPCALAKLSAIELNCQAWIFQP